MPETPDGLHDRAADNWEHMLAIADLAGGPWPEKARIVAVALSGDSEAEDSSLKVQLLIDIQNLFAERNTDRLKSTETCSVLAKMEDRPWPEFRKGKPITTRQLAKYLKDFGVGPTDIRFIDGTFKGYLLSDLEDAFVRYAPPDVSATGQQINDYKDLKENISATEQPHVADKKDDKPKDIIGVADVADRAGMLDGELSLFEWARAKGA